MTMLLTPAQLHHLVDVVCSNDPTDANSQDGDIAEMLSHPANFDVVESDFTAIILADMLNNPDATLMALAATNIQLGMRLMYEAIRAGYLPVPEGQPL